MKKLAQDVTEAVGHVPTVRLNRISDQCTRHKIYLKLESCNPGGSIKEKNAVFLIKKAEREGKLKPGGTIIESSSGNFGIGLAMVGAAKGYAVWIVVDAKTPPPMRRMLEAYGAKLVEVPLTQADANGSMQVARMKKAQELARNTPGGWYPCQHKNPDNPTAHYLYTAKEILEDFNGITPDIVVLGLSTSGQLTGVGSFFREFFPKTTIVGVDVAGSVILGTPPAPYKMTGLGLSFVPPQFNENLLDRAYSVSDQLAFSVCRALAKNEGLLVGASTGAIVAGGLAFAKSLAKPKTLLMINPDRGDRYLETVFSDTWIQNQGLNLYFGEHLSLALEELKPVPEHYFKWQRRGA